MKKSEMIASLLNGFKSYKFFFVEGVVKDLKSLNFKKRNTNKIINGLRYLNGLEPFKNGEPTKDFTAAHNVSLEIIGYMY